MSRDSQELSRLERELDDLRRQLQSLQVVREPVVQSVIPAGVASTVESCDECLESGSITNCAECPEAPVEYLFSAGALDCHEASGGLQKLTAFDVCQWKAVNDGAEWLLDLSGEVKTLTLEIEGSLARPRYEKAGNWCCLCAQTMTLNCSPQDCLGLKKSLCVTPVLECPLCSNPQPTAFNVSFDSFLSPGVCNCDGYGTHTVPFKAKTSTACVYELPLPEIPICDEVSQGSKIAVTVSAGGVTVELFQLHGDSGVGWKWSASEFECFGTNTIGNPVLTSFGPASSNIWRCGNAFNVTVQAS